MSQSSQKKLSESELGKPPESGDQSGESHELEERTKSNDSVPRTFEELSEEPEIGFLSELIDFLRSNRKWWLSPILIVLILVGILIFLTTTAASPYLYTIW